MNTADLTVELRYANGSSAEFYETEEDRINETLRLLATPQLFAQPRLLMASQDCASMIPCKGIDMILVQTLAPSPLRFPLNLPVGLFDISEAPEPRPDDKPVAIEDEKGQTRAKPQRRSLHVELHTFGGWAVTLKAVAMIRGNVQDERQLFSRLPDMPTIPFRLADGGFGLINMANIIRATARPKPEALPGTPLPIAMRHWTPLRPSRPAHAVEGQSL